MKALALLIALCATLAGCGRSPTVIQGASRIVCTLSGEAYYARPGAGDTSFLLRQPEADELCARPK